MAIYTDTAICLRHHDYSEHSQVLSLLTRQHGLVRLIAKGLKRTTKTRVTVGVDLLEMGTVTWSAGPAASEGRLSTLREWRQQESFLQIRKDLSAIVTGQYAAELLLSLLPESDPYPELFEVLGKFLGHIGPGKDNLAALVRLMWLTLHHTGHLPQWERCGVCSGPIGEGASFGLNVGGAVCSGCASRTPQRVRVDPPLSAALQISRPERVPGKAFLLLDAYVTHLTGRPLRTHEAILQGFFKRQPSPPVGNPQ
jgi:DNA repair protein RecO (recombination protein O)